MNNSKWMFLILGIVFGIVGALMYVQTSTKTLQDGTRKVMMAGESIDKHFIEQMIPHHDDAITMAKLAQEKGQREEIKKLADDIITSQTKENEQMSQWYKDWFGREVSQEENVMNEHMMGQGSMHMGRMGDESDIEGLQNSSDFDESFIEEMIPHHQMAIMMAQMLKSGTKRPEMKKLADDIIKAQTSEIEKMRGWYREWYTDK